MKGSRPEQAVLSRDTDMSKTDDTRRVIEGMVDGLNDHRIDDIGQFFAEGFRWMGNTGCGTKTGLKEFQDNWQRPFQAAFSDKVCVDEARLYMGEWAAAFGRQEATHSGAFMGIEPTGKRVEIRYMDFWKVEDGKITDNWVMVDFPHVMAQLGVDVFQGEGWEAFDRGERTAPRPEGAE
ncbi:ester cyclase [Thalassococcus lentus]|uniref:Ester cyclase n=1 Tax=Thalassococcus lentus TaxID=1210524 RepID=A0ABT4XP31_9RHOB|nr:ester cyclase [Thalassococcus lentus]MDA7423700.1 ester cyclase [Thalassococcus lentus]